MQLNVKNETSTLKAVVFVFFGSIAVTSKGYGCEDKSNCILLHFGGNGKRLGTFVNTPQNPPGKAA